MKESTSLTNAGIKTESNDNSYYKDVDAKYSGGTTELQNNPSRRC